ncbi:DUF3263 domain-containing protein [Saccharopolyspora sp. NPDC003752]
MDAAQMLTAQEIARQCEQLARLQQRKPNSDPAPGRRLRLAEPITQPIERIVEPPPVPPQPLPPDGELTVRERGILAFESQWWKREGVKKELAVRELFDMSPSRYYQLLNALLDSPVAERADPMLIKRLRKARAGRQRARAAQRLGIELH